MNRPTLFVLQLTRRKSYSREVIVAHIEHLRALDDDDCLVLGGPFSDGSGGLIVLRVGDLEEAERIAASDPFVSGGYADVAVHALEAATRENNYLLD